MNTNAIDWWMIDGAVGLIVLAAVLRGAVKGVGDTLLKMISILGGVGLGFYYKDQLKAFLLKTKIEKTLHGRIFVLIRGDEAVADPSAGDVSNTFFGSLITPDGTGKGILSKSLVGIFKDAADTAADNAADAVAERLTEIAMGVIAFAIIILAVSIVMLILRMIIRSLRNTSIVVGFADRVLGMVLGLVRGLMLAWIAVALLIPLTTLISPEHVPAMMTALQQTTAAKVLYDVNPLFYLVKYAFI